MNAQIPSDTDTDCRLPTREFQTHQDGAFRASFDYRNLGIENRGESLLESHSVVDALDIDHSRFDRMTQVV
jgi:hypothetical protein